MNVTLSGARAVEISKGNKNRNWSSVRRRLESRSLFTLEHTPRFKIDRNEPIFTMGSCFAREIEQVFLERGGFDLLLEGHGVPAEYFETWNPDTRTGGGVAEGKISRGCFHKYTIHSMSHEIRRILKNEDYPNRGLIELASDEWFDPHASGLRTLPYAIATENRDRIENATATIKNAQVVFFTLGLTESWTDTFTGLSMNRPPPAKFLVDHKDRFLFEDYSFDFLFKELATTLLLIREKCNQSMQFIVTVSPVPLGATFRDQDVAVASAASKATLRAVAESLTREFPFVDYFSSYEMVMMSPRDQAWESDQIHVSRKMVQHVTETFIGLYF